MAINKKSWNTPQLMKLKIDQTKSNALAASPFTEATSPGSGTAFYKPGS